MSMTLNPADVEIVISQLRVRATTTPEEFDAKMMLVAAHDLEETMKHGNQIRDLDDIVSNLLSALRKCADNLNSPDLPELIELTERTRSLVLENER